MFLGFHLPKRALTVACAVGLLTSCIHKKYENPIAKDTRQPDKILFDTAMKDIEHGRYEVARLSLQTLMNTYESSEYMAKAKLAIADSWYREGGANGMAQAEAEYKDFILFYPQMEESAEAQNKVCMIHFRQMEKSDRDVTQALRAEDECRSLIVQFPNSKFAPEASQRLREIQEVLADHEFEVGDFYYRREINPAAANRLNALVDQWPLYSKADDALYEAGDAYSKMGPRFRRKSADMFARIAREYPLSDRANEAKKRLKDMEQPIPEPDPAAVARMKYEEENYRSRGMMARTTGWVRSSPDVTHAAKEGAPTMTDPKRTIPASIPVPVDAEAATASGGGGTATTEVTAQTAGASSALDTRPDARTPTSSASAQQASEAPPINRPPKEVERLKKLQAKKQAQLEKKAKKKNKNSDQNQNQQGGSATASASGVSNSAAQQSTATPANQ